MFWAFTPTCILKIPIYCALKVQLFFYPCVLTKTWLQKCLARLGLGILAVVLCRLVVKSHDVPSCWHTRRKKENTQTQTGCLRSDKRKRETKIKTRKKTKNYSRVIELQASQWGHCRSSLKIDTPICSWCYLVIVWEHFHPFFFRRAIAIRSVLCPLPFRRSLKRWNDMGQHVTDH